MEGLENQKTDLVLNTLRHTQPMKPITVQHIKQVLDSLFMRKICG